MHFLLVRVFSTLVGKIYNLFLLMDQRIKADLLMFITVKVPTRSKLTLAHLRASHIAQYFVHKNRGIAMS